MLFWVTCFNKIKIPRNSKNERHTGLFVRFKEGLERRMKANEVRSETPDRNSVNPRRISFEPYRALR